MTWPIAPQCIHLPIVDCVHGTKPDILVYVSLFSVGTQDARVQEGIGENDTWWLIFPKVQVYIEGVLQ